MLTARQFATTVNYKGNLIVAGGMNSSGAVGIVEVFNGTTWSPTHALPKGCYFAKSVVHNGYWHLVGGVQQKREVYYAPLDALLESSPRLLSVWKRLTEFPLEFSSVSVLGGELIGNGGKKEGTPHSAVSTDTDTTSAAVYAYSPEKSTWVHKGDMPAARCNTCNVVLPKGELLVIGGQYADGKCSQEIFKGVQLSEEGSKNRRQRRKVAGILKERNELLGEKEKLLLEVASLEKQLHDAKAEAKGEDCAIVEAAAAVLEGLRGVEVCGDTTLTVTNSTRSFYWKDYGLRLHIAKDSLPEDMKECSINIKASQTGQYEFEKGTGLVSAVYWFRCEPFLKFRKAISVEVQHCARKENYSKLTFVRTLCTQKQLPYIFKPIHPQAGSFSEISSYGLIELDRFSGIAVTQDTQAGHEEFNIREYCACLYYLPNPSDRYHFEIHFAFTWNTEVHLNVLMQHYKERGAVSGPDQEVEFQEDKISLDVPMDGRILPSQHSEEAWELLPLIRPMVTKKQLDAYALGKRIPSCQLRAKLTAERTQDHTLTYLVKLRGAKPPFDCFTIDFNPTAAAAAAQSTNDVVSKRQLEGWNNCYGNDKLSEVLVLDRDHLDVVMHLDNLEEKQIRRIGGALGLAYENLKKMTDLPDDMVAAWLRKQDNVLGKSGPPTWKSLIEVLENHGQRGTAVCIIESLSQ